MCTDSPSTCLLFLSHAMTLQHKRWFHIQIKHLCQFAMIRHFAKEFTDATNSEFERWNFMWSIQDAYIYLFVFT